MASVTHALDGRKMQCMEIRGGIQAVEESVAMPGLNAWVYGRPHAGADSGGDIYYLSLCGGGVITRLIIADVSGHGTPVASFSRSLRELMRKNINTKSQTRLVRDLNRQFTERAESHRFATAIVATYLATKRRLTLCNAGHPRPLWFRPRTGQWAWLDQGAADLGNLPLGLDAETAYSTFAVNLGKDDLILFYTDALIESVDSTGRLLGEQGLLNLVRGLDLSRPLSIGPALIASVEDYRGGLPADDDTTLLVLHHDAGGKRRLSLAEKLDVYAKVFWLKGY
jgi:phosphoserine phosphatase RsbU/P